MSRYQDYAARAGAAAWKAGWKFATPPSSKAVVISLVAFLIVCATPWLVLQNDPVVADADYVAADQSDIYVGTEYLKYYDAENVVQLIRPSTPLIFGALADGDIVVDYSELGFGSSVSKWFFHLRFYVMDDSGNFSLLANSHERLVFSTSDDGNSSLYCSMNNVSYVSDDGTYTIDFAKIDVLQSNTPKFDYYSSGTSDFIISAQFYDLEDDYSGTTIAFIAGCVLLIMACFATPWIGKSIKGAR